MLIDFVSVAAGCIGLPDFDERASHGPVVFVEDASTYDDALSQRLSYVLTGEVVVELAELAVAKDRAAQLGEGLRDNDQRALWCPENARDIGRM